jgi:hypothetical protein
MSLLFVWLIFTGFTYGLTTEDKPSFYSQITVGVLCAFTFPLLLGFHAKEHFDNVKAIKDTLTPGDTTPNETAQGKTTPD